jgi:hypothetical protein
LSLDKLIRHSMANHLKNDFHNGVISLRGNPDNWIFKFSDELAQRVQWQVLGMTSAEELVAGKKRRTLTVGGAIVGEELRQTFSDAGFADSFTFSAVEERKKSPKNITMPVFDPKTATLDISVAIRPTSTVPPDFQKLDDDIEQFVTMLILRT